ncbi:twitching motility protein [Helicobacter muridarum]|uniref:Twitching mobility protein n=1 Tax=Helicobacter muridarum TaxID=216 RepID=A0A099TUN1_9HELI|nr:ATPase, T2SS/T4P/T4SS family [Helicobacter muridarum]TLD98411.1 twitching motility protein [Helicobacter muridarum]STQ86163.1 twitching mobility protein [Helicobacter muridarum]
MLDTSMLNMLLQDAQRYNATDVHISDKIYFRINKQIFVYPNVDLLNVKAILNSLNALGLQNETSQTLCIKSSDTENSHVSKDVRNDIESNPNFKHISDKIRCRVSYFSKQGKSCYALRILRNNVPSLQELQTPSILASLALQESGLLLICGATSSGKSTTIAAMIDHINANTRKHILTLEDPIEYIHTSKLSYITQREIGLDSKSFYGALESSLRQDPDVIVIGEILDSSLMKLAITHALSGHLVISSFHARNAIHAVSRILGMCKEDGGIHDNLSDCLQGIITQRLYESNNRLQADYQILVSNPAVRTLIKENQLQQLDSQISMGREFGMRHFSQR